MLKQILGAQVCHQLGTSIEDVGMNTVLNTRAAHNMTKHTSAHLKILVRVFCQNKESKLSANIFHQKNILMKQGVIFKVFLWHSQQQLQKLFSKDMEMKTHDVSHKCY